MAEEPKKQKQKRPTALKRHLQSLKRNIRNRAYKSQIKTQIKAYQASLEGEDSAKAQEELNRVYSLMDKGVKKGIIKAGKASRTKSRLSLKLPSGLTA